MIESITSLHSVASDAEPKPLSLYVVAVMVGMCNEAISA